MSADPVRHYEALQAVQPAPPADWLADLRRRGMAAFAQGGFPTTRDEAWKYTSLQPLTRRRFEPARGAVVAPPDAERLALRGLESVRLVFVNGRLADIRTDAADAGVRASGLADALRTRPGAVRAALGRCVDVGRHHFAALNTAFLDDGAFIELDDGATATAPVYLLFVGVPAEGDVLAQPRVVIAAGRNARATVVEHYVSAGAPSTLTNAVTEIAAGPGATIEHYALVEEADSAFHVAGVHARLEADSRLVQHTLSAGARLARRDVHCLLEGAGADVALDGLFVAASRRHTDQNIRVEHCVPHTRSRTDYRGLADAHGRGVFGGKVVVHRDAQRTDAQQSSRNLLLAENGEIDTRPELEIYADDVKCSHGATVGQLDPDALFYLRTRGVDEAHARALLGYAFAHEVVARCGLAPARERFAAALLGALPGASVLEQP